MDIDQHIEQKGNTVVFRVETQLILGHVSTVFVNSDLSQQIGVLLLIADERLPTTLVYGFHDGLGYASYGGGVGKPIAEGILCWEDIESHQRIFSTFKQRPPLTQIELQRFKKKTLSTLSRLQIPNASNDG